MTTMMMTKTTTTATKKMLMIMMVNSQERYFHRSLVPCSENPLNGKMLDAKANGEVDCFSALPSIKIFRYSTPLDAETCRFIISRKKGLVTFDYIFFLALFGKDCNTVWKMQRFTLTIFPQKFNEINAFSIKLH